MALLSALGSRRKSRLSPAESGLLSEKAPPATFSD
jgi:hypothetical protein